MEQRSLQDGIVTKRHQSKRVNSSLASVLCLSFLVVAGSPASANQWSYPGDPGFVATSPQQLPAAKASWETPEYGNYTGVNPSTGGTTVTWPWQLTAVNASTPYALGYYGQGVTLGIMDSGYRPTHEAFQTSLIESVRSGGVYATTGFSYRTPTPGNPFTAGAPFVVDGDQARTSDYSHGTGMLGVLAGKRDGLSQQQGIAFASKIFVAKTGGSDNQSHGPFHDYVYFHTGHQALVAAGAKAINESWGQFVQTLDRSRFDGRGNDLGVGGNLANGYELKGKDSVNATSNASPIPNEFLKDLEYQFFLFKKFYSPGGEQYNPNFPGLSFMDAIWDAIKDSGTVDVRSSGNNDWSNPYYRPAYPLFHPEAENQWIAVGGVQPPTAAVPEYTKQFGFNEAGLAKWWVVSTPSNNVRTSSSTNDTAYSNSSGTSPATPVATASMGILLSRYPNMTPKQAREVMFTTANNKMSDGVRFLGTGQTSPSGASIAWTAPDGLPDDRWGWGIPDLAKGMYGPGQFLMPMVYDMSKAPVDVWSNNISQIAIKQRESEDRQWLASYNAQGIAMAGEFSPNVLNPDGTLNPQAFMLLSILDDPAISVLTNGHPEMYDKISYADAVKWRTEWMDARAAYIQSKIDQGLYTARLTKSGAGTLFLTGNNTYAGSSTVTGGKLSIVGTNSSGVTITSGGTLGGTGTVMGAIIVLNGGGLWPGVTAAEAAAITQVNANVTVTPGDVLRTGTAKIGTGGGFAATLKASGVSSRLVATGVVALGGNLFLDVATVPNQGDVYTLIEAGSILGTFAGLPEGALLNASGQQYRISYQGNRVTITAT
jgi:autotransporter-associated beta strand protein